MRTWLLLALLALSAPLAHADIEGAPFIPEEDARFNAIEQGNHIRNNKFPMGSTDGHWVQQEAQATYDFSTLGGASVVKDLGVAIPKNAVIMQAGALTLIAPSTVSGGQLGFYCQNSGDLLAQTAYNGFAAVNSAIAGVEDNTIPNWKTMTAACNIHSKVTVGPMTAGRVTLYVDYVVHQ